MVRLVDSGWGTELTDALRADASALESSARSSRWAPLEHLLSHRPGKVRGHYPLQPGRLLRGRQRCRGVAGETTSCAIRSMLGRKPSPDIARWAGGRVNKQVSGDFGADAGGVDPLPVRRPWPMRRRLSSSFWGRVLIAFHCRSLPSRRSSWRAATGPSPIPPPSGRGGFRMTPSFSSPG